MDRAVVGAKLRALRGKRTLQEMSTRIGITRGALSNYEHGRRTPSDAVKVRMADVYGKSVFNIFFRDGFVKR